MPILRLLDVVKDYLSEGQPVRALDGISLEVDAGESVALVGRSGCGKSTLLHLAGAMDFPTSGEVKIAGARTSVLDDAGLTALRRSKIGFVFQSFQLVHTLSAVENVELPLLLAGHRDVRRRALERLDWVELGGLAERLPHQLSGGQMQRVAIARALANDPLLLLADEPTGNLDTSTGSLILHLLQRINRERGTTLIMATHSVDAAAIASRVLNMKDGRIEHDDRQIHGNPIAAVARRP